MTTIKKETVKYCAFNDKTFEVYLCTSKKALAKRIGSSVDTIRRRVYLSNDFNIKGWYISCNVEIHKQPKRNSIGFK